MKTKIYYVMDIMCGWCYGFSDVISRIEEKYRDDYEFNIVPGGMWVGESVQTMNSSLGSYIKDHNTRIEKLTGKKFGSGFNKNVLQSNRVLDSLPGAKALVLIQKQNKDVSFAFLKKVQEAFFIDGKDINDVKTFSEIAENLGISKELFEEQFNSKELEKETFNQFRMVQSLGVSSFPTVLAVQGTQKEIIAQGYNSFEALDEILSS